MKQDEVWRDNGVITLTGDKAFWKGVIDELEKQCGGDATAMFNSLEAMMGERVGRKVGWARVSDIRRGA